MQRALKVRDAWTAFQGKVVDRKGYIIIGDGWIVVAGTEDYLELESGDSL